MKKVITLLENLGKTKITFGTDGIALSKKQKTTRAYKIRDLWFVNIYDSAIDDDWNKNVNDLEADQIEMIVNHLNQQVQTAKRAYWQENALNNN